MDPFSLSVGIASLVGLVAQTLSVAKDYLSEVRHAKESAAALVTELEALQSNLSSLDIFLRSENVTSRGLVFKQTSVLRSCTLACESKLKLLCKKLGQVSENKRSRYLWPLSSKEHQKTIQELRTFMQWIQLALSVDGCSILTQTSNDVLSIMEQQLQSFNSLQQLEDKTDQLRDLMTDQTCLLRTDADARARTKLLNTISNIDQDNRHYNVRLPRVEGTGRWFLEQNEYTQWRDCTSDSNVLWCHGTQGCGKSVLTSLVVDELRCLSPDPELVVIFFYFDYRSQETQTPVSFISSCLRQLVDRLPSIPQNVAQLYNEYDNVANPPPIHELIRLLLDVASSISRLYITVDALDECDELLHRKLVLQLLERLSMNANIRLFVTSRPHPSDIKSIFSKHSQITVQAQDSDIRHYIHYQLEKTDLHDIDEGFVSKIVETLVDRAHGLFLLPILQLRTILKEPTIGEMEDVLGSLSQNLAQAFEETVMRIKRLPESRKNVGMNAIMWISHARRSLTVTELSEVLSIRLGQTSISYKYRPSPKVILECCQGLLILDTEGTGIRLAHFAIQEYLTARSKTLFPTADRDLALYCLAYLMSDDLRKGPCRSEKQIKYRLQKYPFLSYSSRYWGDHARNSISDVDVQKTACSFLDSRVAIGQTRQISAYEAGMYEMYWDANECLSGTNLHEACKFGLEPLVRVFLDEQGADVNGRTKIGSTPIIKAVGNSAGDYIQVLDLLLERGGNPWQASWFGSALHCAAEAGCSIAVRRLLEYGMDVNEPSGDFNRRPISCALDCDNLAAFETLVEFGAGMNLDTKPVFHEAVELEAIKILNAIIQRKWADVEMRSMRGCTAMHVAACGANPIILSTLIEAGADVNAEDEEGRTPLDYVLDGRLKDEISYILEEQGAVSGGKGKPDLENFMDLSE